MTNSKRIDTGYRPHKFQEQIHAGLKRFSVLVCHRRFGKTVLCVNALIDACLRSKTRDGRYAYIAPTYRQAKKVAWDYVKLFAGGIPGVKFNEVELRADFENGARISLYGADNPDSLRGIYLDGTVLDEYADFPPDAYNAVIRPALSDRRGFAVFIGTARGHNHLYDLYHKALSDSRWFAAMFPASKTGLIDRGELDSARSQMTDAMYRQEYECDFDVSSEDILIPLQLIQSSYDRTIGYHGLQKVMGLDVGLSLGGDPSAIVERQGGVVLHAEEWRMDDTLAIAGHVKERYYLSKPDAIYVDAIGWGAGVAHNLAGWGLPVCGVNVAEQASENERFSRRRDELWWKAREFFSDKQCNIKALETRDKLASELSTPTYGYMPNGRIKVEGKDELKRRGVASPNLADAFVLTMAHSETLQTDNFSYSWADDGGSRRSRFV